MKSDKNKGHFCAGSACVTVFLIYLDRNRYMFSFYDAVFYTEN